MVDMNGPGDLLVESTDLCSSSRLFRLGRIRTASSRPIRAAIPSPSSRPHETGAMLGQVDRYRVCRSMIVGDPSGKKVRKLVALVDRLRNRIIIQACIDRNGKIARLFREGSSSSKHHGDSNPRMAADLQERRRGSRLSQAPRILEDDAVSCSRNSVEHAFPPELTASRPRACVAKRVRLPSVRLAIVAQGWTRSCFRAQGATGTATLALGRDQCKRGTKKFRCGEGVSNFKAVINLEFDPSRNRFAHGPEFRNLYLCVLTI